MRTGARKQQGLSLVELMVGMAVGLIGITIITHLYLVNEKYKRSTTGSGQAQVNGAIALYTLERDLRMAGFGLNHSAALGCSCDTVANPTCSPLRYWRNGVGYSLPPGPAPRLRFVPVFITETANQPDSLTVLAGNGPERMLPGTLLDPMAAGAQLNVDGYAGFTNNDMLVVAQDATCMLTQVTEVVVASSALKHESASGWNPAAGAGLPTFSAGAAVFNLGANPSWRIYSVANNRLQVQEVLTSFVTGGAPTAIVDDVVDLQAQYGKDTDDNGEVDAWNSTPPASATEWGQVLAVRIAVLARSQNYERPETPGGPCEATTSANRPKWGDATPPVEEFPTLLVAGVLPSCYKYRVFETVIPLRNMIWRPA